MRASKKESNCRQSAFDKLPGMGDGGNVWDVGSPGSSEIKPVSLTSREHVACSSKRGIVIQSELGQVTPWDIWS